MEGVTSHHRAALSIAQHWLGGRYCVYKVDKGYQVAKLT